MCCGQCVHLLISMYFMSIFGPAAVTAARPGLEPSASLSVDRVQHQATWDDYHYNYDDECKNFGAMREPLPGFRTKCRCRSGALPSKKCRAKKKNGHPLFRADYNLWRRGCRCRHPLELSRERSVFVRASALKFCSAILDKAADAKMKFFDLAARRGYDPDDPDYRKEFKKEGVAPEAGEPRDYVEYELNLTQELCREVLTGKSRNDQEWYSEASKLSKHEHAKGFGHLDPLVTGSVESHRDLLEKVCQDECEDIVNTTIENIEEMVDEDVGKKTMPFEQSCADRVVRK
eukprot:s109_g26.t1